MEAVPDASDAEGSCSGSQVCLASGLLRFICCGHQAWLIRVQGLQAGAGILLPLEPLAWIPWCSGHPSCQGRQRQPWILACARGDVAERVPLSLPAPEGSFPEPNSSIPQPGWESLPWKEPLQTISGACRASPRWAGAVFQPLLGGIGSELGLGSG